MKFISIKRRAKLFVFGETLLNKGTGTKSWNERGIGDVKFLKHKENGRIRVLMRQEKTMKVIVNHFLDPRIELAPNVGNEKSWVWVAFDFAEGELAETVNYYFYYILFLLYFIFILDFRDPLCFR